MYTVHKLRNSCVITQATPTTTSTPKCSREKTGEKQIMVELELHFSLENESSVSTPDMIWLT